MVKKSQLVNVVCERPLSIKDKLSGFSSTYVLHMYLVFTTLNGSKSFNPASEASVAFVL